MFFSKPKEKSIKDIQREIRDVMRQITASVTFLPLLDGPCEYMYIVINLFQNLLFMHMCNIHASSTVRAVNLSFSIEQPEN